MMFSRMSRLDNPRIPPPSVTYQRDDEAATKSLTVPRDKILMGAADAILALV